MHATGCSGLGALGQLLVPQLHSCSAALTHPADARSLGWRRSFLARQHSRISELCQSAVRLAASGPPSRRDATAASSAAFHTSLLR